MTDLGSNKMPAAVIMGENYDKLLEQCETQELEAPGGIATPQVYAQLLVLYLLHNDMNNARYLWKRIPQAIKSANLELTAVWAVGQRIWQRDFPGIYSAIAAHQWSENILPVMEALRETTRRRAYGLVAQAYTSIMAEDFAAFVGYSVEDAVKGVVSQGWQADPATRMVMPQKPDPPPVSLVPNEQQLARLTDYVAFLEN
ncbi:COP9 signalosome complex subunit 8 [Oncorhynchus tshawytscha]|uniref:COP9 signalosome complex subunit 8 n=4 Tax=Oncorhynchus TaxID=8016 RepID=A0A8C7DNY2_ONCKI|nr:COP9 signalosome complex subunit 8 isoform X1 [Oncorhynchus kisutch]XP_021434381.1 COP9 signalosome complex subunit 8 [Oncorhynchus mykiss]XP_024244471.1 COP9 signalosome complex subunit 8 [Oncorhynchus tshawytscha]XP_035628934.1 COP9 signalosome complex subunit 8 isoform X1 [Oncorhynchus keta]XP_046214381.1 COP9 signalosome complex subunit 8 [Oncorhynchus gorbuscha]